MVKILLQKQNRLLKTYKRMIALFIEKANTPLMQLYSYF
jgi:hypothetical protein